MARKPQPTEAQQHIAKRRVARKLALIGAYQWIITQNEFQEIYLNFQQDKELASDFRKCDAAFFHQILSSVIKNPTPIEEQISPHLDRKLTQVDPIESAVLRIATAELLGNPETPYKVVVNEAVNLTKKFGGDQAHKYINGVLDKVATATRQLEISAPVNK
uniref:Transcription antitermination protein NusB n=1 Tax=uncultured Thiotrichaceae bacterium TaxID=298394 RepID=A0A6S6SC09_9GAMM|nr:MAG: Transcription termination protein NusB [uncultured Thiotrichaceae bacterium]